MFRKLLFICYIVVAFAKPCKYWCKNSNWEYYCCPEDDKVHKMKNPWASMMGILIPHLWIALGLPQIYHHEHDPWTEKAKPKKVCPPTRHACPKSNDWWYDPPVPCYHDDECSSSTKCCFDICLNHRTCKPAEEHH